MKKLFVAAVMTTMFASAVLFADVKLNKQHKGKAGLEGEKINCVYCHTKAKNPKKDISDAEVAKLKKDKFCAMKGCH